MFLLEVEAVARHFELRPPRGVHRDQMFLHVAAGVGHCQTRPFFVAICLCASSVVGQPIFLLLAVRSHTEYVLSGHDL